MRRAPRTLIARLLRYGAAGVLATLIYAGCVVVLVEVAGVGAVPATVAATLTVLLTSYGVNRAWVFETNRGHVSSLSRFALATGLSISLNAGLMAIAAHVLAWPYLAGVLLATMIVPPVNFMFNALWAFRPAPQTGRCRTGIPTKPIRYRRENR